MEIIYTDYVELPAPLPLVYALLRSTEIWQTLPTGAKHLGTMWRCGNDLYTICFDCGHLYDSDDPADDSDNNERDPGATRPPVALRWHVAPVTIAGAHIQIEVTLHDAIVATHATVRLVLVTSRHLAPFARTRTQRHIAKTVRACNQALCALLYEQNAHSVQASVSASVPLSDNQHTSSQTHISHDMLEHLRMAYPKTIAAFDAMDAYDHLERVLLLEQGWERCMRGAYDASIHSVERPLLRDKPLDFDLIYAGGGLGLLHAAVMACCYGWRVLVFDRGTVGCAHREWNISREELHALVTMGVVTWNELEQVIMREYRTGLVSFHTGSYTTIPHSELWMPDVLSLAIDAQGLLDLMRRKVVEAGGTVLDHRLFTRVQVADQGPMLVDVELAVLDKTWDNSLPEHTHTETYRARLLLDGMGSTSPLALRRHAGLPFAGVCPTVGSTVGGFVQGNGPRECDPTIGDILISVADTQYGRQLIWEGFPGRDDEVSVYVFYYVALNGEYQQPCTPSAPPARAGKEQTDQLGASIYQQPTYSLLELFEHYFTLLPSYKKPSDTFRNIKPLYGYIPGRHSLRANEAPLLRGVLPIGDAAAQQSPLTYCGFGSHIRNLHRTTSLLDFALRHDVLEPHHLNSINAFQTNVSLNWVFSRFMQPWGNPDNVNELQNVFLGSLNELGVPLARRFFQDRTRWSDYNRVLGSVLQRYPIIMAQAWRVLKFSGISQWVKDYVRFTLEALLVQGARAAGPSFEQTVYRFSEQMSPDNALRIRARYAEWRAMTWLD